MFEAAGCREGTAGQADTPAAGKLETRTVMEEWSTQQSRQRHKSSSR